MNAIYFRDWYADHVPEIINEIFVRKIYDPYIKHHGTYIDLGANIGMWTMWAYPAADRIIAVEPASMHIETFRAMIKNNKMEDKVTTVQAAISTENGSMTLHHAPNTTAFSLYDIPGNLNAKKETVETITLTKLFADHHIDHVDLMKMDIEGEECKVFASSDFDALSKKIDQIVFEYHNYSGVGKNNVLTGLMDRGYTIQQLDAEASVFYAGREHHG